MKNFIYSVKNPDRVDWRNPFRFNSYGGFFFIGIMTLLVMSSLLVVQSVLSFLVTVGLAVFALAFLSSVIEAGHKGYPLWSLYAGTPVMVKLGTPQDLEFMELWLEHNVRKGHWSVDFHSKEKLLQSQGRVLRDLSFLSDNIYILFLNRSDALLFKLHFG